MTRLVCVLLAAATLADPAPAQTPDQAEQAPIFRSGSSLVALNVTVTDLDKRYIGGLGARDFAVYEDGVLQNVRFFESNNVPIDLIILLDSSASMTGRMDVVHEAAVGFIRTLRPGDRGALVVFHDVVVVAQSLTAEIPALETAIRRTVPHGATALHNAVYIAIKQFGMMARQEGEVRRQAIVVLSDGDDTASLVSFEDVLEVARKSGVAVYAIGLQSEFAAAAQRAAAGGRKYFSESEYSMKKLAQETGAQAFFATNVAQLAGIYGLIAEELSKQYSIGYEPSNGRFDGRFRRIVVRVASQPELRLRARTGYVAEPARGAVATAPRR